jgi:hypothetical protein
MRSFREMMRNIYFWMEYTKKIYLTDPPRCKDPQPKVFGVTVNELLNITCEVDARPGAFEFEWTFNSSSSESSVTASKQFLSAGSRSYFSYAPKSTYDYGDIACWAKNDVGEQKEPCWFRVIEAGPPEQLENCSIQNRTDSWLQVECEPGFDGGTKQQFVMELWDPDIGTMVRRVIENSKPSFTVDGLSHETNSASIISSAKYEVGESRRNAMSYLVVLYANNSKGQSSKITLEARMPQVMENRMGKG